MIFLDGPAEGLTDLCWELQPDIVVTRGAMETPEQSIPGAPLKGPWESCITMGTSWQYQPTDEVYKSGTRMIEALVETRAKGGNLLLNVGPKPDGELPIEQEQRLQEIALWMFVNGESIHDVRPWTVTNEGPIWFTRKPGRPAEGDTVYAIVTGPRWAFAERRSFVLRSVKATSRSEVSVLGQSGKVLEYHPDVVPKTEWRQDADGLKISATNSQRLHDDRKWPNPAVIRITHAEPGLEPPVVETVKAELDGQGGAVTLHGKLASLGGASSVDLFFQYRRKKELESTLEAELPWIDLGKTGAANPGGFSSTLAPDKLAKGQIYEFRAVARHPRITVYGVTREFVVKK